MVKEELNSEEKFFEKAVMTEKFVKKYKKAMIASVVAVVVIVAVNVTYEINKQNTIDAANETLRELQKSPQNEVALSRLATLSPELHDVWVYSQAIANKDTKALQELKSSKAALISDLSSYELATDAQDTKELNAYAMKQDAVYKDLAIIQEAVILIQSGKNEQAHKKLAQVPLDSSLAQLAKVLMHYGVK
jgi:hypothetical protein